MKATLTMKAMIIAVIALLAAPILEAQDKPANDRRGQDGRDFDIQDLERRIRDRLEKEGQNDQQNDQEHAESSSSDDPDEVLHQRHADGEHDRDVVDGVHKGYARHHLAGIRAGVKPADFKDVPKELTAGLRGLPRELDRDQIDSLIERFRDRRGGDFGGRSGRNNR